MASYMSLCEDCDRLPTYPDSCYELYIQDFPGVYGHLIEPTVRAITWGDRWGIDHDHRVVKLLGSSERERQDAIDRTLEAEREKGTFKVLGRWTNERFPIFGPNRELIVTIERSAAALFGIVTYGVQLIVYRDEPEGVRIWLARRSPKKTLYPNRLGVTIGGSLASGETPFECVVREAHEEAGLQADLVKGLARSVGTISYVTASDAKTTSGGESGLIRAEIQYTYDMKVDPDVQPKPYDMEASDISLYTISEVKKSLAEGEFTPANACLIVDFFIRHGIITFDNEPNFNQIISRLHRPLGIQTA